MIEQETQEGEVEGEINPHTPKTGDRAIVNPSYIAIIIHYPIEDGVPANHWNDEVADEKRTQKDDDVGFQPIISKGQALANTEHRHESRAHMDANSDL